MKPNDIYTKLKTKFGDKVLDFVETPETEAYITISPASLKEICLFARDDKNLQFDYLSLLSGVDNKENLSTVYHLFSTIFKHKITLKVVLSREKPSVISVERVWKSANWHERETFDMFGIVFEEHPDLSRILCPEDWTGYPLRKDYVAPTEYNGIDATPNNV